MNLGVSLLGSAAVGAGVMYLLDPDRGRRRRSIIRDKAVSFGHRSAGAADATARDLAHRARGVVHEAKSKVVARRARVDDDIVQARVKTALGRVSSHPAAIFVTCTDGVCRLSGPILRSEVDDVVACARGVPGVRDVECDFDIFEEPGDVPGLQGGRSRAFKKARSASILRTSRPPATRLLAGIGGLGLAAWGTARRDAIGGVAGIGGVALLVRALTNLRARRLLGGGGGRGRIDTERKTVRATARGRAPRDAAAPV